MVSRYSSTGGWKRSSTRSILRYGGSPRFGPSPGAGRPWMGSTSPGAGAAGAPVRRCAGVPAGRPAALPWKSWSRAADQIRSDDRKAPRASDQRETPDTGDGPGQAGDGSAGGRRWDRRDGGRLRRRGHGEVGEGKDPLRFSNWMKRSATGAVMTGIAVGLKEALQTQKKEVPFVIESREEPDDPDKPIDLHFDPDSPNPPWPSSVAPGRTVGTSPPPPPRADGAADGA